MNKKLLLGAEAVGQGAIDAGISGAYAYPGTPSTEITEYIQRSGTAAERGIRSAWSANEKTAYEAALGMSFAGKRSIVSMKHVGLNVAADGFVNSAVTGVNGGLVLVVADDPSMHSSQNEQDSRVYGKFAMVPILEPSNQQELYDGVFAAFELSERTQLPVMVRMTTRLSHSRAAVCLAEPMAQKPLCPETEAGKFVLLPQIARDRYALLVEKQVSLERLSEDSFLTGAQFYDGKKEVGIIAFGIAYNYVMEVVSRHHLPVSVLKIGQYPLPKKMIRDFLNRHDTVLIAEEGYPVAEELIRGLFDDPRVRGRLDNVLPRTGELTPDAIAAALGLIRERGVESPFPVPTRPPQLCKGCSHRDLFVALHRALDAYAKKSVFSDIGCYTLGALPPFNSIHSCVEMGASITMAKGAADAGMRPAIAVIGDSTFTHSGITGLLDAVNDHAAVTVVISDNYTTAMTGGQASSGTGKLFEICKGIGADPAHIRTIVPLEKNIEENVAVLKEEFAYDGVSVIIASRECIQTAKRHKKASQS